MARIDPRRRFSEAGVTRGVDEIENVQPDGEPAEPEVATEFVVGDLTPILLARAAHPRLALLTTLGVATAAALSGRAVREVVLVAVTCLVGQLVLGWSNDLSDRSRDTRHRPLKPLVTGPLEAGTVWFSVAIMVLAVVPLALGSGVGAGAAYLLVLVIALIDTWSLPLRRGFFSWVPWALSYGLYPAFLSHGGWGGGQHGSAPTVAMTLLAALLGPGVHLLASLPGSAEDRVDGWTCLPSRLAARWSTTRLRLVGLAYCAAVLAAMALVGATHGLAQPPLS